MQFSLIERRTSWRLTWLGWLALLFAFGAATCIWLLEGETFLAISDPLPARVLIVEGWIGEEAVRASIDEFRRGNYERAITTGGLSGDYWSAQRWNYAEAAREQFLNSGIPQESITSARSAATESDRTYACAAAARDCLTSLGFARGKVNIFTRDVHARRSRLVFQRAFGSNFQVGVVAWHPPGYDHTPWWRSSTRSEEFFKETAGYLFELILRSGRGILGHEPGAVVIWDLKEQRQIQKRTRLPDLAALNPCPLNGDI
jgi:DUF218 domain-containing protein